MVEFIRGIVRPFLAVSAWGATIAFLCLGYNIPGEWWTLVGVISTFYFVHRHEEKKKP